MRLPTTAHTALPWRIHEIAPDFAVEDVWALPVTGGPDDFPELLAVAASLDFPASGPLPVRVVWAVRDEMGRWLGLGRISVPADEAEEGVGPLPIPGAGETTLVDRLPDDLRATADTAVTHGTPLRPVYRTSSEYVEELSNRTVHSVMHLGWVEQDDGSYRGQMAVLVKPRGLLGSAYMALIKPFRYALVYPALLRAVDRAWQRRPAPAAAPDARPRADAGAPAA
jgi:hypothetical protein